jgi:hypothetical protein
MTVTAQFADDPMNIQDWGSEYYEDVTDENGQFEICGYSQFYGIFVLRVDGFVGGNQLYFDEYYDNSQNEWGAQQFELYSGYPVDGVVWMLNPIPEGQNP